MAAMPTILIVDDDFPILKMLAEAVRLEGYPVETATNGREGLEILTCTRESRIILLDLLMPVLTGREFMEELQANPAARARHIIILISATHNLQSHDDLGADYTLSKPFDIFQLYNLLDVAARKFTENMASPTGETLTEANFALESLGPSDSLDINSRSDARNAQPMVLEDALQIPGGYADTAADTVSAVEMVEALGELNQPMEEGHVELPTNSPSDKRSNQGSTSCSETASEANSSSADDCDR